MMMGMRAKMQVWIIAIFEQCGILIVLEWTLTLLQSLLGTQTTENMA